MNPKSSGNLKVSLNRSIQVPDGDPPELGAVDLGHQVLQTIANTRKYQGGESGKDSPCCRRQAYSIRAGQDVDNPSPIKRCWSLVPVAGPIRTM